MMLVYDIVSLYYLFLHSILTRFIVLPCFSFSFFNFALQVFESSRDALVSRHCDRRCCFVTISLCLCACSIIGINDRRVEMSEQLCDILNLLCCWY
jgi:hypothetical protein